MAAAVDASLVLKLVFCLFTLALCVLVPLGLAIFMLVRHKGQGLWKHLLMGAGVFIVTQLIIRVPILSAIQSTEGYLSFAQAHMWLVLFLISLSAALFEEFGRFGGFSILKNRHTPLDGIANGIGHGGIEAIALVGMTYVNNILLIVLMMTDAFSAFQDILPSALFAQLDTGAMIIGATPAYTFLLGGVERVFTIIVHIALSVLISQGFQNGRRWLNMLLAIAAHTAFNFIVSGAGILFATWGFPYSNVWTEVVCGLLAVLALVYILIVLRQNKQKQEIAI